MTAIHSQEAALAGNKIGRGTPGTPRATRTIRKPRLMGMSGLKGFRRVSKPGVWERGYLCHVYWCGRRKLGVIHLGVRGQWDGAYRWECPEANLKGAAFDLKQAKDQVESLVHAGVFQMDLFADGAPKDEM